MEYTYEEIAEFLNISPERARQIGKTAIRKIKIILAKDSKKRDELSDFFDVLSSKENSSAKYLYQEA